MAPRPNARNVATSLPCCGSTARLDALRPAAFEDVMKISSLEEHYRLPAIEELAKPDDP
jgi:hypothetical protein